jgi:RNA polymerase sigma-70 factor (ECF subfamily)
VEDSAALAPAENRDEARREVRSLTADALCEGYAARVFKFAQFVSKDAVTAEDLAQDALERAIRGLKTFDPSRGEIEAWLWRIVVNASRDAGRVARRQRLLFELLMDRWSSEVRSQEATPDLESGSVLDAVRSLSARHRAVVALRYGADMSYGDVGRALGISEAAALMATRRALAVLRKTLSQGVETQ